MKWESEIIAEQRQRMAASPRQVAHLNVLEGGKITDDLSVEAPAQAGWFSKLVQKFGFGK